MDTRALLAVPQETLLPSGSRETPGLRGPFCSGGKRRGGLAPLCRRDPCPAPEGLLGCGQRRLTDRAFRGWQRVSPTASPPPALITIVN